MTAPPLRSVMMAALLLAAGCRSDVPSYRDARRPVGHRVADLLARMTLEEKFWQLVAFPDDTSLAPSAVAPGAFGIQVRTAGGAREAAARIDALQRHFVEETRLGIPFIPFEEALHGLVQPGATTFPQAIGLAATWDTALVGAVASTVARQTRERGFRQVLSPVVNVATDARWGRVEETYGEDPFLGSRMAVAFVRPFERAGVVTTPKHFVANVGDGGRDSYPIDLDRRALAEIHFPPFEAAIREGGARSIMSSYNAVGGVPASASSWLLTDQLKKAWGFEGVVISDAGAVGGAAVLHMTAADYPASARQAVVAGLDVIFQGGRDRIKDLFFPAFERGEIPGPAIDSAVSRVLRLKFDLGLFDHPFVGGRPIASPDSTDRRLARTAASASLTLLMNRGVLPLGPSTRRVALVGEDADRARLGGYSGPGNDVVTLRSALEARLGPGAVRFEAGPGRSAGRHWTVPAEGFEGPLRVEFFRGIGLEGTPVATATFPTIDATWTLGPPDQSLERGWYSVRWTGRIRIPPSGDLELGVDGNDGYRLRLDGKVLIDAWQKRSTGLATRTVRLQPGSHDLVLEYFENVGPAKLRLVWNRGPTFDWKGSIDRAVAMARVSQVALVAAGIEEGEFRDRSSLRLPGHQEELIRAVARTGVPTVVLVFGGSPITMGNWIDSVAAVMMAWYPGEAGGEAIVSTLLGNDNPAGRLPISFPKSEGQLPLSYFHRPTGRGDDYLDQSGRPEFPFGFGLSYSRFEYRDAEVSAGSPARGDTLLVRFKVKNLGPLAGDEVAQVYLRDEVASVSRPVLMLAGFGRIHLAPMEERTVTIGLAPDRFSMLDASLRRVIEPGKFDILIGASSADIRLRSIVDVR